MKRIPTYFIVGQLLFFAAVAHAQDFKQAIAGFHKKYQSAGNIRIKMSIDAFESKAAKKPFYQEKVTIAKHGTAYHHRLTATEMIMNDRYIIMVDHSNRQISFNKRDVRGETEFYKKVHFDLDSALKFYEEGKYEGTVSGVNHFSMTQEQGDIQKIDLFFEQETGDLQQINYLYRTGHWVAISLEEFDVAPTFDSKEFDEGQFIRKEGKSWQPVVALAGYQVLKAN